MRSLSRISAVALAAALALSVSSCSKDGGEATPDPKPTETSSTTASPSPTATTSPSPSGNPTKKPVAGSSVVCADTSGMAPFTGPAAVKFGPKKVMDAYCEMGDFFYLNAVTNLTAPKKSYEEIEFSFLKDSMTPEAQADWDKVVKAAVAGKADGQESVNALIYFNLTNVEKGGFTFPKSGEGPMMVGGAVSKAQTEVATLDDGREVLAMTFSVNTNIIIKKGEKDYGFPVTRDVSLYLLPSNSGDKAHDWLLYSWNTSWKSKDPQPLSDMVKG